MIARSDLKDELIQAGQKAIEEGQPEAANKSAIAFEGIKAHFVEKYSELKANGTGSNTTGDFTNELPQEFKQRVQG